MGNLPTRKGPWIGRGNERQMMSETNIGDFRKRYRTNPDGSVTMLKTRGGWPQFTTTGEKPPVPPKPSVTMIFQAYPYAEVAFPATPHPDGWEGGHVYSNTARVILNSKFTTAKGDTSWFGDSPHVVTWFGMNGFGRNNNSLFLGKSGVTTRYNAMHMSSARELMQLNENVYVDGEVRYSAPDPYRVVCAAIYRNRLRVVLYNKNLVAPHTGHAKDGNSGNHISYRSSSPLLLVEVNNDPASATYGQVLNQKTVAVVPEDNIYGYAFSQAFVFNGEGSRFIGIVGLYASSVRIYPQVREYDFQTGSVSFSRDFDTQTDRYDTFPAWPEVRYEQVPIATGLPDVSPNNPYKFRYRVGEVGHKDPPIPLAVDYEGGASINILVKTRVFKRRQDKDYQYRRKTPGLSVLPDSGYDEEVGYAVVLDLEPIAEENDASYNAARVAVGLTPIPESWGSVAPHQSLGLPGDVAPFGSPSLSYFGVHAESRNTWENPKPFYLWAMTHSHLYDTTDIFQTFVDESSVIGADGEAKYEGYALTHDSWRQHYRRFTVGPTASWDAEYSYEIEEAIRTINNPATGLSAQYVDKTVYLTYNQVFYDGANTATMPEEIEEELPGIVACDLWHNLYITEDEDGVRTMHSGFPSREPARDVGEVEAEPNLPDQTYNLLDTYQDWVRPLFGISAFTVYPNGRHAVFAKTDPWNGPQQLSGWSSGTTYELSYQSGSSGPVITNFEAPIFFRK